MTQDERRALEIQTMTAICRLLPKEAAHIWSDGEDILCDSEQCAETIADFIDAMYGVPVTATGYYDPKEDEMLNLVDDRTGYHYVTIC